MTSGPKEKEYIHTGCELSLQLAQGCITAGGRTAMDTEFFIVARKVACGMDAELHQEKEKKILFSFFLNEIASFILVFSTCVLRFSSEQSAIY